MKSQGKSTMDNHGMHKTLLHKLQNGD